MAERYTAETVELLTRLLREHGDEIQRADDGLARVTCWCGSFEVFMPRDESWDAATEAFRQHRSRAVLNALANAGLLMLAGTKERTDGA